MFKNKYRVIFVENEATLFFKPKGLFTKWQEMLDTDGNVIKSKHSAVVQLMKQFAESSQATIIPANRFKKALSFY